MRLFSASPYLFVTKGCIIFFGVALLASCGEKPKERSEYVGRDRDSLLINYVIEQFSEDHYNQDDLQLQLTSMRNGHFSRASFKSIQCSFNDYKLTSFQFDAQTYPPFVVEITDKHDDLVSLFSFTDEMYYLYNELGVHIDTSLTVTLLHFNGPSPKLNVSLEARLNHLIKELGIDDEESINNLIDVLFGTLLEMQTYDEQQLGELVHALKGDEKLLSMVNNEFKTFHESGGRRNLRYRSKDGNGLGCWKFWLEKKGGTYYVRARFFSDILFDALFM